MPLLFLCILSSWHPTICISSDIIFWKSKANIEPYKILKYNNEDGGNSFVYRIEDIV